MNWTSYKIPNTQVHAGCIHPVCNMTVISLAALFTTSHVYYIERISVTVKHMSASWDSQAAKLVLNDINFMLSKVPAMQCDSFEL